MRGIINDEVGRPASEAKRAREGSTVPRPKEVALETVAAAAATVPATIAVSFNERPCFINGELPARQIRAVEFGDCSFCSLIIHFHEPEALGSTSHTVGDNADGLDLSDLAEKVTQFLFGGLKRQVTYK